jgi:large subunit ribosomal protein L25
VEAEATSIPQGIDVDVDGMEIGAAVHAGDLNLPAGVTLQVDPETLVLHVIAQPTAEEPEEAEAAEEAPEAPEAVAGEAAGSEGEQAG